MLRAGLIAILLGTVGGFSGVWIGLNSFSSPHDESASLHSIVHGELLLTEEQEARIAALERDYAERRLELENRMAAVRQGMGETLLRDQSVSPEVIARETELHAAMGELQIETLEHIIAMRDVLTEAQRTEFDARLAEAFDAN